ncbi:2-succinyl-5-enolpyruvyl-6-hydroxy-3-cyclohexene-1-carboxylic-acid synthase [Kocuria sp. cx-455]|uniref:2-succinyl-5-enolpyruvyl-6-hydroxy-3- cyclohexene-1-carboxylic-acid synthase n=1 Tax=Kocuria sp. cx-455 TaxID=2771377 RepID=UPI003D7467AE
MITPSLLTATTALSALARAGMEHMVIAPGSRSAPVAYAAAAARESGALRVHVRIDERAAAFTALGISRSTGRPVAVLTTSGTAVGNLLPAVMEASHSGTPLVALTADRPPELRGTGANQTTFQPGVFAAFVRAQVDLVPDDQNPAAETLDRTLAAAGGHDTTAPGPVHLNLGLRDPLYPRAEEDHLFLTNWAAELAAELAENRPARIAHPWAAFDESLVVESPDVATTELLRNIGSQDRGQDERGSDDPSPSAENPGKRPTTPHGARAVVMAGDGAGPAAARFAADAGLPLMAEPSSNARFGPSAVPSYQNVLELDLVDQVDTVVLVGRPTLSRHVAALLRREDVRVLAVRPEPVAWFEEGRRDEEVVRSFHEALDRLGPVRDGWFELWEATGVAAGEALRTQTNSAPALTGLHVAHAVWDACAADGAVLVAGSSNPIRDLDLVAWPGDPVAVVANRGVSGIDGTVATAHGVGLGTGRPVRVFLGDLTFLHDAGALLVGDGEDVPNVQLVVLNDNGGGIFGKLEHGAVAQDTRYTSTVERFFGTPHRVSLPDLCAAYGVEYSRADTAIELAALFAAPVRGRRVIEVPIDRAGLREFHQGLREAAQDAARQFLAKYPVEK